jgi:hypothetical protein
MPLIYYAKRLLVARPASLWIVTLRRLGKHGCDPYKPSRPCDPKVVVLEVGEALHGNKGDTL